MSIAASLVKELREKTGVGMMDCKKALEHSGGDFEAAVKYLREKGLAAVSKKSDRETKEGKVFVALSADQKKGVILELNCETDFVANNTAFSNLGNTLAQEALANPAHAEALVNSPLISECVLKLGENITLKRQAALAAGAISSYIHMNGKIGVLIGFTSPVDVALGKDVAMHTAAAAPTYLLQSEVPADEIEKEKDIIRQQAINEGKPPEIAEKMVMGRMNKYYKDVCLVDQDFVKDPAVTISKLVNGNTITGFLRFAF